jgi:hypothetical protein
MIMWHISSDKHAFHRVVICESIDASPFYLLLAAVVGCVASPKSQLEKCVSKARLSPRTEHKPSKFKKPKSSPSP